MVGPDGVVDADLERSARRIDQLSNSQCVVPLGHVLEGPRQCRLAHGVLGSLQNLIEQRPKLESRSKGPLRGRRQERDERLRQLARRLFGHVMPGVDAVAGDLDGPVLPDGEWVAI